MSSSSRTRRGPRTPRACEICRIKKIKCDGLMPCHSCRFRETNCVYTTHTGRPVQSTPIAQNYPTTGNSMPSTTSISSDTDSPLIAGSRDPQTSPAFTDSLSFMYPDTSSQYSIASEGGIMSTFNPLGHGADVQPTSKELGQVLDTNSYTNNIEFHGSSSTINFLQLAERGGHSSPLDMGSVQQSLVSCLHNPAVDPDESECSQRYPLPQSSADYFPEVAMRFIQGYFDGLHYAQPLLYKEEFLSRCQQLWLNGRSSCTTSFLALYYAVLGFGALTMVWAEDELVDGQGRFEWSRKLLEKSRALAGRLCQTTDLESVQCFLFLAKICQNELSPHTAYIYVGRAVRTALAMGLNRDCARKSSQDSVELCMAQTRTWWAVYSLEIEISFSLGRPDSLSHDGYHTRPFPRVHTRPDESGNLEPPEVGIIEYLVRLARLTREISTKLYCPLAGTPSKTQAIGEIDLKLDGWLNSIPSALRPTKNSPSAGSLELTRQPAYIRKQKLVLGTKYHNVRMLLHASLIDTASVQSPSIDFTGSLRECVQSARLTIELVYENYCHHEFFRTWWFNTTYAIFASTIILFVANQNVEAPEKHRWQELIQNAIEILGVMDENVVARKAAGIMKGCLDRLKRRHASGTFAVIGDENPFDMMFDERMMELQQSFPFDVASWDGAGIFPWANFGPSNPSEQTPDPGT
ncbi:hypothetical protein F53441_13644 [Fusarium austroafricanum]|uniref:Zn(2)-C6 fungal-type domain-containing protein n=1 Tax=Fusarium austroafricanum TaxID=2364996 RepID=A0A8H4NH45_9HYPO|nr:hypothetical protein F53441_13644 [Fusarium austroafricanum]